MKFMETQLDSLSIERWGGSDHTVLLLIRIYVISFTIKIRMLKLHGLSTHRKVNLATSNLSRAGSYDEWSMHGHKWDGIDEVDFAGKYQTPQETKRTIPIISVWNTKLKRK